MIQVNDEEEHEWGYHGYQEPSEDPVFWVGGEKILTAVNYRSLLKYYAFGVKNGENDDWNEPRKAEEDKKYLYKKYDGNFNPNLYH